MKKQLFTGLTLAALSIGIVVAPIQQALAINFPNFQPGIQADSDKVKVIVPKDLLEAGLSQTLRINEQRLKDTEFNRFTLKDTSARMRGDQLQVNGVIQLQHRELIAKNPFTGKKHYSPWVSASGRITQNFGIQIKDNKTIVSAKGNPKIEGLEGRWYAEIVSLGGKFVGPQLAPRVHKAISVMNGIDVRQFAIDKSSASIAFKLGLDESQVRSILNQYVGTINANINAGGEFVVEYNLPNSQLLALTQPPQPTPSSACISVDSRSGWQHFNLPGSFTKIASISGGWSVDSRSYSPVGSSGHSGADAEALAPYNQYKLDQQYPFGALLMRSGQGTLWIQNSISLSNSLSAIDLRINDSDNALGDNAGSLEVCFSN